ncbi:hypothetical protein LPJ66_001829 [Kickxella alabastrina]|uniref:Uncharacterized protein n=1 Tax=Kickxella alabastrina TaxID=61397 RepID=A0ACC1IS69_9FUNG|nr:hypothetical protein LPJ66_001829 [Kickxella alabastrina]
MQRAFQRAYTSVSFMAPMVAGKMSTHQPRLQTLAQLIPPLTYDLHKGDCGRVAAIGGCEEYTGAPYFVASTALRLGADIAHVICEKDAASVIKGYSPDIIVYPYLRSTVNRQDMELGEIARRVGWVLDKMHAVSIGSGLGNDDNIRESVGRIIVAARERGIPMVLDADSLALVGRDPDLVRGYQNAVLTPNAPEFARLCDSLGISKEDAESEHAAQLVAEKLGGVTIVKKGKSDVITNGKTTFVCEELSGLRRCGGQGDILSGAIATFLAWGHKYKQGKWKHTGGEVDFANIPMLAAYSACLVARHASFLAFDECGRATQSTSILDQVDIAFDNKFDEVLKAVRPPKK